MDLLFHIVDMTAGFAYRKRMSTIWNKRRIFGCRAWERSLELLAGWGMPPVCWDPQLLVTPAADAWPAAPDPMEEGNG
jgi:hypothetical protein